jgi:hypothetical protein
MSGIGYNIEILGGNHSDGIGSRLVKMALTVRRISTIWTVPFEALGALQNFNTRERLKGEILRRYNMEAFRLLRDNPDHGVLIKAQIMGDALFNARLVGSGPDPESVAENDWCDCGAGANDTYFWITAYSF